jgi:hypothetical protein
VTDIVDTNVKAATSATAQAAAALTPEAVSRIPPATDFVCQNPWLWPGVFLFTFGWRRRTVRSPLPGNPAPLDLLAYRRHRLVDEVRARPRLRVQERRRCPSPDIDGKLNSRSIG